MRLPLGKGVFGRRVNDMAEFAKFLHKRGFTYVAPFDDVPLARLPDYAGTLHDFGLGIWPIAYSHAERWQTELAELVRLARDVRATGLILNPEITFKGRPEFAAEFMAPARSTWPGPLGIASYPITRFHRDFPWSVFAEGADFGMPLMFDRDDTWSKDFVKEGISEWHGAGFAKLILGLGAYHGTAGNFRTKTVAELARHLETIPPIRSGCFFTLPRFQTDPEDYAEQWELLTRYDPLQVPFAAKMIPGGPLWWRWLLG